MNNSNNSIILISHDFHRAGAQINLLQTGKNLRDNYDKHVIFVAIRDGNYRAEFEKISDEVYPLMPNNAEAFTFTDTVRDLFQQFVSRGINQCICNTVVTGVLAPLLKEYHFNFVNLIHELPVSVNIYNFHLGVESIKTYGKQIVFSSEYTRDSYINNYGYDAAKTLVKAQGCYFSSPWFSNKDSHSQALKKKKQARKQLRKQLFLSQQSVIILTCGHLYFRKGPDVFLDLAKKILQDKKNINYHFVWLGGHEFEALNWFDHDKQKMGIENNVHYVDFVDDPALFYAGADCFVLTAREDPFPTVVMEAMDNCTPAIAFYEAGGIPELLADGCGRCVSFLDTQAMADNVLDLMQDKIAYQQIVEKAKHRVVYEYDFTDYIRYILNLLDQQAHPDAVIEADCHINVTNRVSQPYIEQLLDPDKTDPQHCDYIRHNKLTTDIKMLAFFLPQFHPIPENDAWWGKGFTEWTNVTKAVPQFVGHYQPKLPGELGFYDLRMPEITEKQVALAKNYGISGFCFYYYWFSGRRILEKPVDLMLANKNWDMPFCLCWANESWSRRWDGSEESILLEQKYDPDDDIQFIQDLAVYLQDRRYIRIDDKPLVIIYRPDLLPDPKRMAKIWRDWCREHGIGEIYLCNVHTFDHVDPQSIGYDACIEFPPNQFPMDKYNQHVDLINKTYAGTVYNYPQLLNIAYQYETPDFIRFRGITPGWDNEARRTGRGTSFINNRPDTYKQWLNHLCHYTQEQLPENKQYIFVNAWNEWAEGAYLEPDNKFGYAFLEATYQVLSQFDDQKQRLIQQSQTQDETKNKIAVIVHLYYFELWDEIKGYLANIKPKWDLYISLGEHFSLENVNKIISDYPDAHLYTLENCGRDIYPFLHIFKQIKHLDYTCICKLHSKKSTHTDVGDSWRQNIYRELLGSAKRINQIIEHFEQQPETGIISPKKYFILLSDCWGFNEELAEKNKFYMNLFLEQISTTIQPDERFVTGSMFWFRPQALYQLLAFKLSRQDYPPEQGQIDGTIMHGLERMISICARTDGFLTLESDQLEETHHAQRI
jgi:lipopolysaccharide biosynthesis protein/glycosyltransferase involved in cell wall biosynthesis